MKVLKSRQTKSIFAFVKRKICTFNGKIGWVGVSVGEMEEGKINRFMHNFMYLYKKEVYSLFHLALVVIMCR